LLFSRICLLYHIAHLFWNKWYSVPFIGCTGFQLSFNSQRRVINFVSCLWKSYAMESVHILRIVSIYLHCLWGVCLKCQLQHFNYCSWIAQLYSSGFWAGLLGFSSWEGQEIFLFSTASRLALGTSQPPIQWVPGPLSLGVKPPGREADHSHPCSANFKIDGAMPPLPHTSFWCGA
jgi:hypothetical protein